MCVCVSACVRACVHAMKHFTSYIIYSTKHPILEYKVSSNIALSNS